ncbi:MAG: hypothetical protein DRG63_13965 [Deltaproteobacteria bacterium]|nr:MAG: hypothetical protein DRG63_13965 [Deltaproteobacteria bacterium]
MFETLLQKIALCLEKYGLPYMVIGGQAVLLYGEPRLTRDIDITLGCDITRLPDLLNSVQELSLTILPKDIETFVKQTMVLPTIEEESGVRVDFIFSFTPYEAQAIERAKAIKIGEKTVKFASVEDLIIHKIFAGRPRDLEDVKAILTKNPDTDVVYIETWLAKFDESLQESRFLQTFRGLLKYL